MASCNKIGIEKEGEILAFQNKPGISSEKLWAGSISVEEFYQKEGLVGKMIGKKIANLSLEGFDLRIRCVF